MDFAPLARFGTAAERFLAAVQAPSPMRPSRQWLLFHALPWTAGFAGTWLLANGRSTGTFQAKPPLARRAPFTAPVGSSRAGPGGLRYRLAHAFLHRGAAAPGSITTSKHSSTLALCSKKLIPGIDRAHDSRRRDARRVAALVGHRRRRAPGRPGRVRSQREHPCPWAR